MLLEKITEKDRELAEQLYSPITLAECLFVEKLENFDSLQKFEDDNFFKLRLYQIPFISYEYMIANNPDLNLAENFELKKGAGNGYYYCGRKIGKSLVALLIDMLLDSAYNFTDSVTAFSAFDAIHVKHLLEPYIKTIENHPFFKLFKAHVTRHPFYNITFPSGHTLEGVNMNVASKAKIGAQWERIHASKIYIDEHQYEPDEVVHKRSQSTSERGAIERFAGITSFKRHSPAGKIYDNLEKRNWLSKLPQTISSFWNEGQKKKAIEDYDGEETLAYKIHVLAEVCESAEGLYDMERIRKSYNSKKTIKKFEINKNTYDRFKELLIIERPKNCSRIWIAGDFGESAPTEIIIIGEIDKKGEQFFKYLYNISLHRLIPDEQTEIFKYLAETMGANFIGIDCSEQGGRQIYRDLSSFYSKENLVWVAFNEKLPVGFEKDDKGKIKYEKGTPVYQKEYVIDWSIRRIKYLIYDGEKIEIPYDFKFDKQFGAMISMQSSNRTVYACSEQDHLHASFQVFAIMHWMNEFNLIKPIQKKEWGTGISSWD